jgi:hypothetical protein
MVTMATMNKAVEMRRGKKNLRTGKKGGVSNTRKQQAMKG